jgi:hypothetical protein
MLVEMVGVRVRIVLTLMVPVVVVQAEPVATMEPVVRPLLALELNLPVAVPLGAAAL